MLTLTRSFHLSTTKISFMKKTFTLSALALFMSLGAFQITYAQVSIEGTHVSLDQYPQYEEMVANRGAQERTFAGPDGTFIKQQTAGYFNYLNSSGNWTPINADLKQVGQEVSLTSTGLPISVNLGTGETRMTLQNGQSVSYGDQLSMVLKNAAGEAYSTVAATTGNQQQIKGQQVLMGETWPGIDRKQRIEYYLVETDYILKAVPSFGNAGDVVEFRDELNLPAGWVLREGTGVQGQYGWVGTLEIVNANGERVGEYQTPIYYDNSNTKGKDSWVQGSYRITQVGNTYEVAVAVSMDWLLASHRVYPVTIDPSVTNTYSTGAIDNNFNAPSNTCSAILTMTVPMAANVDFLNTSYQMTAQNGAYESEQEASIVGPTGTFASTSMGAFAGGTQNWLHTNLNIANGVVAGTTVDIEIQPWRTWGGTLCDQFYQIIPANSWTVELFFNLPPPPTGYVGPASICLGDSIQFAGTGIIDTLQWFTGGCGASAGGTMFASGDSIYLNPTSTTTYYIRNATSGGDFSACFSFTVFVSDPSLSVGNVTDVTCNGGMDGNAQVSAADGTAPYAYTWVSTGTMADSDSNLTAGMWDVAVVDTTGCVDTLTVVVGEPDPIVSTVDVTGISCAGEQNGMLEITDITGGTPFQGYLLDTNGQFGPLNGLGTSVTLGDDVVSPAIAMPFTFTFYGIDYTDIYISSNGFLTFDAAGGSGCCSGQNLPDAFTPNNVIAFAWEDLNTSTNNGAVEYFTVGSAPNRIFVVEFTDVHLCCGTATPTVTSQVHLFEGTNCIQIHTSQAIFTTGNNATMGIENADGSLATVHPDRNNQSWDTVLVDFTGFCPTTPYTMEWSTGDSAVTMIDSLAGGTYFLTITDAAGCTQVDSFNIVVPDPVTVSITSTDITCFGDDDGTAASSATGGTMPYEFLWSDGDSLTSKMNLTPNTMLSVTVTDANGCQDSSAVITILEPTMLTASISASIDIFCAGQSTGSATAAGAGGTAPYNYVWDDANAQTTAQASNLPAGTYNAMVTDGNGCTTTISSTLVDVNPLPPVSLGSDTIIFDGFLTLDPGPGFISYLWLNGSTNQTYSVTSTGTYWVIVTDGNGCTNADSIFVTVEVPLGVNTEAVNLLSVFPNPSTGDFFLSNQQGDQEMNLSVVDVEGRVVYAKTLNMTKGQTEKLSLNEHAQGVYILSVTTEDETHQYRLIVE